MDDLDIRLALVGPSLLTARYGLTTRGTPRQRAPKGTFDRKAWQRDYQARQRRMKASVDHSR